MLSVFNSIKVTLGCLHEGPDMIYVAVRPREQGAAMIIRQEEDISAGRVHFGRKVVFRPKVMSFGRFRLSAEIYDLKILSFGSGRKSFG